MGKETNELQKKIENNFTRFTFSMHLSTFCIWIRSTKYKATLIWMSINFQVVAFKTNLLISHEHARLLAFFCLLTIVGLLANSTKHL